MKKEFLMDLEDETFNGFKMDFSAMLENLLTEMISKGVDESELTAKFSISLLTDADGAVVPSIIHKVTSVLKVKNERSGVVGGENFELEWDQNRRGYIMKIAGQRSIFDNDYDGGFDE